MSTLAHVLESQGLATVVLSSVRSQTERVHPPRALHCEFPLGRPLGKPGDAAFQRRVLDAAFALLDAPEGPMLVDFPEVIEDEADDALVCALPPAVDEALGLRAAYERQRAASGRTFVGRGADADHIADAVAAFARIADGAPWQETLQQAGLTAPPPQIQSDIRAYYEEAAVALAEHVPAARTAESWFYRDTETGRMLKRAQSALRAGGYPHWFFFLPATQSDEPPPG